MKSLILLLTIFLCTLSLNTAVLGQEQEDDSNCSFFDLQCWLESLWQEEQGDCPFVLFHIIKEAGGWHSSKAVADLSFWLQYGADVNPNLEDECFDPYYTSLPKGSTLLHVLMTSSISDESKISLYWDFLADGADRFATDENGYRASDLFCWPMPPIYREGYNRPNVYTRCKYGMYHGNRPRIKWGVAGPPPPRPKRRFPYRAG